jgi:hypothetical protein
MPSRIHPASRRAIDQSTSARAVTDVPRVIARLTIDAHTTAGAGPIGMVSSGTATNAKPKPETAWTTAATK